MIIETLSPHFCGTLARQIFGNDTGYKNKSDEALDKEIQESLIGTTYNVCSEIWNLIRPGERDEFAGGQPKHLFWALLFLKSYATESILTRVVGGVDKKTFRKWTWLFLGGISDLKTRVVSITYLLLLLKCYSHFLSSQIVWANRFAKWDGKSICLISVDCCDCPIRELYPFSTLIFSEKFNGPAYKYEVGVCIQTGHIVWVNGPFNAEKNDKSVFADEGLRDALCDDEAVEADNGYQGDDKLKCKNVSQSRKDRKQKGKVGARQENVFAWMKAFAVLEKGILPSHKRKT